MRTISAAPWLVPLLVFAVPGCSNECDELHTRLQACGYGANMPARARFIAQCRNNKGQFKVMLRCVGKRDCRDFRECVEAADATFSTEQQEPVARVAQRLQDALRSRNHAEALHICASTRRDYSKDMRSKCDRLQAVLLVRGLRAARLEGAFTDLKDFCWQHRATLGNRTRVQCKHVLERLYDYLVRQALRVRDHGPYDGLPARCKALREAEAGAKKGHPRRALALCDDLNVAEPSAQAITVVEKALAAAKVKSPSRSKTKTRPRPAMQPGGAGASTPEDRVTLPYQCGSVVKTLEKLGSKFALKRRDELVRLCYVRLGRLILARDVAQKDCSYHGGKVLAAIRKYKLTGPRLDPLVPRAKKRCDDKAAREAIKSKRVR